MSFTVRAKFFVAAVNTTCYSNQAGDNPPTFAEVVLNPVYSPNPDTENHKFWCSSPSGKMVLNMSGEEAQAYPVGSFWYIDENIIEDQPDFGYGQVGMNARVKWIGEQSDPKSVYTLTRCDGAGSYINVRLEMNFGQDRGYIEIGINNEAVFPAYWNKVGSVYSLKMTRTTKEGS